MNLPADILRREIAKNGPISFSRFMEVALYAPETGYYERIRNIGRKGDFYTSVSVGSLFGELLACQFAAWLEGILPAASSWQIVEAGAHNGQLAVDILGALRAANPDAFRRTEYWIIEPSLARRKWQEKTLGEFVTRVRWFNDWLSVPAPGVAGVIFSNELLDAMPVNRFRWNSRQRYFREDKVTWNGDAFAWISDETGHLNEPLEVPPQLAEILPDGFIVEHSSAAASWWKQAATALRVGKLIAIDYGQTSEEIFQPERGSGTLRAYASHHVSDNPLANPGEQDITAHVNLTSIQAAGEACGLRTHSLISQSRFLTEILQKMWTSPEGCQWDSRQTKQFQTLTHPEHLGQSFRVLIQER
jgi:SAM-dependent MidA family methyltransferase